MSEFPFVFDPSSVPLGPMEDPPAAVFKLVRPWEAKTKAKPPQSTTAAANGKSPNPAPRFDEAAIRKHVEMLHQLAKGIDGVLTLCVFGDDPDAINPKTGKPGRPLYKEVRRFEIGDVDGMVGEVMAWAGVAHANVYAPLAVMRRDLGPNQRGGSADIVAVLGQVADMDGDTGRVGEMPLASSYVVKTSTGNLQPALLFEHPLKPAEAHFLAQALQRATKSDSGTGDIAHVWRIPGTLNWPNAKKVHERGRPREPQAVRLETPWAGDLINIEKLTTALASYTETSQAAPADKTARDARRPVDKLFAELPAGLKKLIASAPFDGEDQSATAASVIPRLACLGWADCEISSIIEAHRNGLGKRYADGKDLPADIMRLRHKFCDDAEEPDTIPTPLFDPWDRYVVPAFPLDILPPAIARFVKTQSAVVGCDPSTLAMAALANFSAALDHRFAVKLMTHGDWWASPRLWVLLVGDSSRKKTPIINTASHELEAQQNILREKYEEQKRLHLAALGDPKDGPPPPVRYVVYDSTPEKLGEILARYDRGVLVKRDEFAGFLGAMERYGSSKSANADRAFWLQAFDGGPYAHDRIGRGEIHIRNLSVSLIGGIQPARLAELHGLTSDGLLQRFLPVLMGPSTFPIDQVSDTAEYRLLTRRLLFLEPKRLLLSNDAVIAMERLRRHLHNLEQSAAGLADGFPAFLGKLAGYAGSLTLILHMIDEGGSERIATETVERAALLIRDFILPHAFEFYRLSERSSVGDRLQRLASWILTSGKTRIVPSDLTSNVGDLRGLSQWDLTQRVSPLVAGGWLIPNEPGPVPRSWTVAPSVLERFAVQAATEERRKAELAVLMASPRRGKPIAAE